MSEDRSHAKRQEDRPPLVRLAFGSLYQFMVPADDFDTLLRVVGVATNGGKSSASDLEAAARIMREMTEQADAQSY